MRSMTPPLKETTCIACPTASFLRGPHSVCALLGLISDSVSWLHCYTFSSHSSTAVTAVSVSLAVLLMSLQSASVCSWIKPVLFRPARPFVQTLQRTEDKGEPFESIIASCLLVEIQFASRMARFCPEVLLPAILRTSS